MGAVDFLRAVDDTTKSHAIPLEQPFFVAAQARPFAPTEGDRCIQSRSTYNVGNADSHLH